MKKNLSFIFKKFSFGSRQRLLILTCLILSVFAFCGCSFMTFGSIKMENKKLDRLMTKGECDKALERIKSEKSREKYGNNANMLYFLNSAMISMQCKEHNAAKTDFNTAENTAKNLWTQSLTKEAGSWFLDEYTKPYRGEDFERVLINLFSGFNYIMMKDYNEAMVEFRGIDVKLSEYNKKYGDNSIYKEDALGRYLSGILSEITDKKNYSEAFLYYLDAYKAYADYQEKYRTPIPSFVTEDLIRMAKISKRTREIKKLIPNYNKIEYVKQGKAKKLGKIVFINLNGKGPRKEKDRFSIYLPEGSVSMLGGDIEIAFPKYVTEEPLCPFNQLILTSNKGKEYESEAVLAENINSIAKTSLEDRKNRINFKAGARVALKQALIESEDAQEAEALMKAAKVADIRAWETLPAQINMTRIFVPAGDYEVAVERCYGEKDELEKVSIKAGETEFIFYDTVYSAMLQKEEEKVEKKSKKEIKTKDGKVFTVGIATLFSAKKAKAFAKEIKKKGYDTGIYKTVNSKKKEIFIVHIGGGFATKSEALKKSEEYVKKEKVSGRDKPLINSLTLKSLDEKTIK